MMEEPNVTPAPRQEAERPATPIPRPKNMEITELVALRLERLLTEAKVCESHGGHHARDVLRLVACALAADPSPLSEEDELAVLLAALLHDGDDRKFFPENHDYENARLLLKDVAPRYSKGFADGVIAMIKWVSASTNRNAIPVEAIAHPWKLYPRHADRIAGIGWTGVHRCWQYTLGVKRPLYTPETVRASSEEDLWARVATPERYAAYTGSSVSMVDHYYDKLLHIGRFQTDNLFFREEARLRGRPLIDLALEYGRTGALRPELYDEAAVRAGKEYQGGRSPEPVRGLADQTLKA